MCLFISSIYAPAINLSHCEKTWEDLELIGATIEKDALPIKQVLTSKSLGVRIDQSLSWECHINEISKKFASGISVIKCIRYFLPFEILLNICNFLVQPHFEFCDGVWGNCSKNLSSKLQKLQTHAAHVLTFSNYECSTSELFQNLKWSKLVHQHVVSKAIMMHRPPQPRAGLQSAWTTTFLIFVLKAKPNTQWCIAL